MKRSDIIKRINAIEPLAQERFALLHDHLNCRLNDPLDPMMDYEIDLTVLARADDGSTLYSSSINCCLFDKEALDMEYIRMNHNDRFWDEPPENREYHSYLYHDLADHSPQSDEYSDRRVNEIASIHMEVTIWEQFRQDGTDLAKAIRIARENLPRHAETRALLTDEVVEPEVVISAYMFEDDPDCRPVYARSCHEIDPGRHSGVEDPYEGVIKYYALDDASEMEAAIAKRTEFLFTDIQSSFEIRFSIAATGDE